MKNYKKDEAESLYLVQLKTLFLQHTIIHKILIQLQHFPFALYLSAGVIRNLIWVHLHDEDYVLENTEIDVIFYHQEDDGTQSSIIESILAETFPFVCWDVTNQALVHEWYTKDDGTKISPLHSIEHALSLWPETATAVAIRLNEYAEFECIAPLGLSDLFELKLRWNKALVSQKVFRQRIQQKQFLQKWPQLVVIESEDSLVEI